jgi:hypothetical protein
VIRGSGGVVSPHQQEPILRHNLDHCGTITNSFTNQLTASNTSSIEQHNNIQYDTNTQTISGGFTTPQRQVVHNVLHSGVQYDHHPFSILHQPLISLAASDLCFGNKIITNTIIVSSNDEGGDNSCNNSLFGGELLQVLSSDDNTGDFEDEDRNSLTDSILSDAIISMGRCSLTPTTAILFNENSPNLPVIKSYRAGGHKLLKCGKNLSKKSAKRIAKENLLQIELTNNAQLLSIFKNVSISMKKFGFQLDFIIYKDFRDIKLDDEYGDRSVISVSGDNNDCFYQCIIVSLFLTSHFNEIVKDSINKGFTNIITPATLRKKVSDTLLEKANSVTASGTTNLELFRLHEPHISQYFSVSVDLDFQFKVSFATLLRKLEPYATENEKYLRCFYSNLLAKVIESLSADNNYKINNMDCIDNVNDEPKIRKIYNLLLLEYTNIDHDEKMAEGLRHFNHNFEGRVCLPNTLKTVDQLYLGSHMVYKAKLTSHYKESLERIADNRIATFNDEISICQTAELLNVELVIHEFEREMIILNSNPFEIKHKIHLYKQLNHWHTDIDERDIDQNRSYNGGEDDVKCLDRLKLVKNIPFISEEHDGMGLSHDNLVRNDLLSRTLREECGGGDLKRMKII